ncbi:MAG TPA: hypothetical protein VE978_00490 [Chitinophagales bacterium]|nr:hypothetical protein [Chitinophagales bacterium]
MTIRYNSNNLRDSLPEKLKNCNRQLYYKINDQYTWYIELIRPKLDSLSVKTIEPDFKDSLLTFEYNNQAYTININYFKDNDGVVFYKPGKKPVLWTLDRLSKYCTDMNFVDCYFK